MSVCWIRYFQLMKKNCLDLKKLCLEIKPKSVIRNFPAKWMTLERWSITFTSKGKREFVPRDQVSPLLVVTIYFSTHKLVVSRNFFRKNCFEHFLSANLLFWEILNLNLTLAVYVKPNFLLCYWKKNAKTDKEHLSCTTAIKEGKAWVDKTKKN